MSVPTLTIVDNADGTGIVVTVADSAVGSINTLYTQAFDGQLGHSGNWTANTETLTGDGIMTVLLDAGHYFGYVHSLNTNGSVDISLVNYFAATNGLDSVHYRALGAVAARILLLQLETQDKDGNQLFLNSSRVLVKKIPFDRAFATGLVDLPGILVTPEKQTMNPGAGTNLQDDVIYPVLVTIVDRDNQEPTLKKNLDVYTLWMERIAKLFRSQRLPGVTEIWNCAVDPADPYWAQGFSQQLYICGLRLRFTSRERRGLT